MNEKHDVPSQPWQLDAQKVRRRRLYEEVAEKIEAWIRSGYFSEGDRLPSERELTATLGAGRSSVREALFALDRRGIVRINNGGRAIVTRPSPKFILGELSTTVKSLVAEPEGERQLQDARCLWETAVAKRAAAMASDADVAELERLLAMNERAMEDVDAFARTDVAFHDRIAEICGNPLFTSLNNALAEWLREQRLTTLRRDGVARAAWEAHKRIFLAIEQRNPEAAEAAMNAHLTHVSDMYWQAVPEEA